MGQTSLTPSAIGRLSTALAVLLALSGCSGASNVDGSGAAADGVPETCVETGTPVFGDATSLSNSIVRAQGGHLEASDCASGSSSSLIGSNSSALTLSETAASGDYFMVSIPVYALDGPEGREDPRPPSSGASDPPSSEDPRLDPPTDDDGGGFPDLGLPTDPEEPSRVYRLTPEGPRLIRAISDNFRTGFFHINTTVEVDGETVSGATPRGLRLQVDHHGGFIYFLNSVTGSIVRFADDGSGGIETVADGLRGAVSMKRSPLNGRLYVALSPEKENERVVASARIVTVDGELVYEVPTDRGYAMESGFGTVYEDGRLGAQGYNIEMSFDHEGMLIAAIPHAGLVLRVDVHARSGEVVFDNLGGLAAVGRDGAGNWLGLFAPLERGPSVPGPGAPEGDPGSTAPREDPGMDSSSWSPPTLALLDPLTGDATPLHTFENSYAYRTGFASTLTDRDGASGFFHMGIRFTMHVDARGNVVVEDAMRNAIYGLSRQ